MLKSVLNSKSQSVVLTLLLFFEKKIVSIVALKENSSDLYLVFLFGILTLRKRKKIHEFSFAFRLCAKDDLGKVHLVCALCSFSEEL